jgi:CheY-like chemotaxis protein
MRRSAAGHNGNTATATAPGAERYQALVVEDDTATLRMLRSALTRAGIDCAHAPTGEMALEMFELREPHLIIVDLQLPGISGEEVCKSIRARSAVPIFALTDLSSDAEEVNLLRAGVDGYLMKPFNPMVLAARVISVVRRTYRYNPQLVAAHAQAIRQNAARIPVAAPPAPPAVAAPATRFGAPVNTTVESVSTLPPGWASCERCHYMGPRNRFDGEDSSGRMAKRCPVCKESQHIVYSLV